MENGKDSASLSSWKVHRRAPELISPAKETPGGVKPNSTIDDQDGVRSFVSLLFFYKGNGSDVDPVQVIRNALSQTLVYYYPFAGRLRQGPHRRLVVDCTAEGAVFVEACADVGLDYFGGDAIQPPIPSYEELLPVVEDTSAILDAPLLYIQVTRLKCGSFAVGIYFCHVMCEGIGMTQFLQALGEMARGDTAPSVPPVWERHLLDARHPPEVSYPQPEYEDAPPGPDDLLPLDKQFQRSFFFSPTDMDTLRAYAPPDIREALSDIELIASVLWRCRTIALKPDPKAQRRVMCGIDVRPRLNNPPLPQGYYGNAFAFPVAIAPAEVITGGSLELLIRMVHEANAIITDDYVRSMIDFLYEKNYPVYARKGTYVVSDVWLYGLDEVDFGWGNPTFSGVPAAGSGLFYGLSYFIPYNKDGVSGTLVPVILTESAMAIFAEELARILDTK